MFAKISHQIHDHVISIKEDAAENPRKTAAYVILFTICLTVVVSLNFTYLIQNVFSGPNEGQPMVGDVAASPVLVAPIDGAETTYVTGNEKILKAVIAYDGRGFENMTLAIEINEGLKKLGFTADRIDLLPNIPMSSMSYKRTFEVFLPGRGFSVEAPGLETALIAESYADLMGQYVSLPSMAASPIFAGSVIGSLGDIDGQPTPMNILGAIRGAADADTLLVFLISSEIELPGGMLSSYDVAEAVSACDGDIVFFDLASDIGMIGNLRKYLPAESNVLEFDSLKTIPHRTFGAFADLRKQLDANAEVRWADLSCAANPGAPRSTLYQGRAALKDPRRVSADHMFFEPIADTLAMN